MSSISAIKPFFDQNFEARDVRIQTSDFKRLVEICTKEFDGLELLSSIKIPCHLKTIEWYYRKVDQPIPYFVHLQTGSRYDLKAPIPYEIVFSSKLHLDETFFYSDFVQKGLLTNDFSNLCSFLNVFDDTSSQKEVKWGDYKWLFFYSKTPLFHEDSLEYYRLQRLSIIELLQNHQLDIQKITFNDLFQLKMNETQSRILTELILFKTKSEELFNELDKNIPFCIELLHQLNESKSKVFEFKYQDSPISFNIIDHHIGAALVHKNEFETTLKTLTNHDFIVLNQ